MPNICLIVPQMSTLGSRFCQTILRGRSDFWNNAVVGRIISPFKIINTENNTQGKTNVFNSMYSVKKHSTCKQYFVKGLNLEFVFT